MTDPLDLLLERPDDELGHLLFDLRWLMVRHPVATRSALRALAAEGRRFAETPAGAEWKYRLAGSDLVRRGQTVLDVGTWGAVAGDDEHMLPTQLIDAIARASARRDLETAIARRLEIDESDAP